MDGEEIKFKTRQSVNKLIVAALFLVVFLVYVAPFFLFEQASSQAALTRYALLLTGIVFIWQFRDNFSELGFDNIHVLVVLLLFLYLLLNSIVLSDESKSFRRLLLVFLLFLPFVFLKINTGLIERIIFSFVFLIFLFSAFSLVYSFFNETLPSGYRHGGIYQSGVREVAYFGNTIVAGLHYGVALIGAFYFFLTTRKNMVLAISSFMIVSLSLYIYLTFARTAWVAVGAGFIVLFALLYRKELIKRFLFVASAGLLFAVNYAFTRLGYEVGTRGLTYRDEIWKESILRIKEHAVFGHGLLNKIDWIYLESIKQSFNNSHSMYLEILYQVGAVGLALYLMLLFYTFWVLYQSARNGIYGKLAIFILAVLTGGSLAALVDIIGWIDSPNYVWMWIWVPLASSLPFSRELKAARLKESVCS